MSDPENTGSKTGTNKTSFSKSVWNPIHTQSYSGTVLCYFSVLLIFKVNTVKSFNFIGMKFCILTTMDIFVDTWICGFLIIRIISKVNESFVGILNSWLALPTKKKMKCPKTKKYLYNKYTVHVYDRQMCCGFKTRVWTWAFLWSLYYTHFVNDSCTQICPLL